MKLVKSLLLGSAAGLARRCRSSSCRPSRRRRPLPSNTFASAPPTAQASSTSRAPKPASASAAAFAPSYRMLSRPPAMTTRSASAPAAASSSTLAPPRLTACCAPFVRFEMTRTRRVTNGCITTSPERRPGLHPVRWPDRRSRRSRSSTTATCPPSTWAPSASRTPEREPLCLHLHVRQRLLGHAVDRRRPRAPLERLPRRGKRRDPELCRAARCRTWLALSNIPAPGVQPSSRLRCIRSAATTCS